MRLCLITTFYPPYHFGGDAIFVYRLAQLLAENGHDVDVFHNRDAFQVLSPTPPRPAFPEHTRVTVKALHSRLPLANVLAVQQTGFPIGAQHELREVITHGAYDAVHFHNVSLMGAPEILRLRPNNGAPTAMTIHEHWLVCPMHVLWRYDGTPCDERQCLRCQVQGRRPPQLWRYTAARDRAVRALDVLFAPSRFTQTKHRAFGMQRETQLLPHFVPDPGPPADAPAALDARPYFLFVGRLEHIKGAHTLIEVFRRFEAADLWIAGDGAERPALEAQARGMRNVRFLGNVTPHELPALYANARAALVPSLCYEVFGLIAVEALASATPIVVRNRGPLPEIVEQSGAGFVYDDDEQLLERLKWFVSARAEAPQLKQLARAAYLDHWTPQKHLDRYLSALRVARGATPPH